MRKIRICPLLAAANLFAILSTGLPLDPSGNALKGESVHVPGEQGESIPRVSREETPAMDVSKLTGLSRVVESVADKNVVYIGEQHDRFSHHKTETDIIKRLHRKNEKVAIGMEMFQRPFQGVLDDYIAGRIQERDFLKKSEYFQRWGFDYRLYKPILDFAREEKIPVIALNAPSEIVRKVATGGLQSLSAKEKTEIPAQMDLSDTDYKERLKSIFHHHPGADRRSFDFFFQAQVVWDETMAMSIDEYLERNPDYQMIVLAGQEHIAGGSGIPERAFHRNAKTYATILNDIDPRKGIADFILWPPRSDDVPTPALGVMLQEDGEIVRIARIPEDSPLKAPGLLPGDAILFIDDQAVRSTTDVRLALFYKKRGTPLKLTVRRRRFLLGEEDRTFLVKLD